MTGNLTWSDSASYGGGYNTNVQNNTINGNSIFTILGSNQLDESNSAQPNIFNGNVTYNCNGSGTLITSENSKTVYNGNLTVNRTVAGYTRLFANGATITGNFSYTKNNAGATDIGQISNKTTIGGTINMNVTQNLGNNFSMYRIQNLTNGGSITVQNTSAPNIQQDSLLVTSFNYNGYGTGGYAYLYDNQIQGDLSWSDDASYGGGYNTNFVNNTILGNTSVTINGSNTFYDAYSVNNGNTYIGNVTYARIGSGIMNIGYGDTNSYAGNLIFNNVSALPINADLIKFTGNTNTSIDQLSTWPIAISRPIINKSSSAKVTLSKPVQVSSSCIFTSGYVSSTTTNPLIFPDNISYTGAADNSHVVGAVTKIGNDAFTFPLGNGIGIQTLGITAPATTIDTFQASIVLKHPSDDGYNVASKDAALIQIAPYHYWTLNQIHGANSETVTLGWSNPCVNAGITNLPGMVVARWNSTTGPQWNNLGNSATTGTTALGTVTQTGTTANYGVFDLATTTALNAWQITSVSASASTVCQGVSTTLTATGANTYAWQPGSLTGSSVTVAPSTTTTYTVTGTSATGCITTATKTITVNPLPPTGTTTSATAICIGASVTITGTGANTYAWQPGSLTGSSITVSPASTTTYTVTGTLTATGCTLTSTRLITVNPLPVVGTTATTSTICVGASTTITGTGAVTYTWQPGSLSGTSITVAPSSTTTYTVTGTNANGCVNTATRLITVNPLPTVGTTATLTSVCIGTSTTITGTGATTYTWQPGALSGTSITVAPASTTTYTVTGTNANGCINTATRVITVNIVPPVGTNVTSASICSGSSTTITGTGANTYTWQPGSLSGAIVTVSPTSTTTYTVTGTNTTTGCTATSTRTITVNNCTTTVNLKLFLEGYYKLASTMNATLQNQGVSGSSTVTDTITVELRNSTAPYAVAATTKAILNTNGTAACTFNPFISGNYYIAVKHRNSIQTWSSTTVSVGSSPITYDFSNLITKAYGSNMKLMTTGPNVYAFFTGDVNQDENVDAIDLSVEENDINGFLFGYQATDINGDGNVDILDELPVEVNVSGFVFSIHP